MRHNENYQHIARELMRNRLAALDLKAADQKKGLSAEEVVERGQLQELLSQMWRDCPECLGVGRVRFAYTAILSEHGFIISRVDEDQPGHTPQPAFETFPTPDAAMACVKRLNGDLGLSEKQALEIVTSSIRIENIRERKPQ